MNLARGLYLFPGTGTGTTWHINTKLILVLVSDHREADGKVKGSPHPFSRVMNDK